MLVVSGWWWGVSDDGLVVRCWWWGVSVWAVVARGWSWRVGALDDVGDEGWYLGGVGVLMLRDGMRCWSSDVGDKVLKLMLECCRWVFLLRVCVVWGFVFPCFLMYCCRRGWRVIFFGFYCHILMYFFMCFLSFFIQRKLFYVELRSQDAASVNIRL